MNFPTYQVNFIGSKSGTEATEPNSGALWPSSEASEPVSKAPEACLEAPRVISEASEASLVVIKPSKRFQSKVQRAQKQVQTEAS